jgi:uncharacterized protein YndB with AHSA1/START domain
MPGEILEIDPPNRLLLQLAQRISTGTEDGRFTRCSFELAQSTEMTRLIVNHEMERAGSKMIESFSDGWPKILSSLKSLIETGKAFSETTEWPRG